MTSYFALNDMSDVVKNLNPKSDPKIIRHCKRSCLVVDTVFKYNLVTNFWLHTSTINQTISPQ